MGLVCLTPLLLLHCRPAVFKATPKSAGGKAAKKAKAPSAFKDLWMQVRH